MVHLNPLCGRWQRVRGNVTLPYAGRPRGDLRALVEDLGLQVSMLQQQWSELSVSGPWQTPAVRVPASAGRQPLDQSVSPTV